MRAETSLPVETAPVAAPSLLIKMAERYTVEPSKMLATLKATAFRGDVSNEQMMALLIVADQYNLNPWLRQIYAFPDTRNGIVPVVGVDGWTRIINEHPQFDGMEFKEAAAQRKEGRIPDYGIPVWIECVIYRKDRAHPIAAREYFEEVRRDTPSWKSHPRRMLRHKALIQCARMAFGFAGIYDPDEAERVIEAENGINKTAKMVHAEREQYSQAKFEKNLPAWRSHIENGSMSVNDIVAKIESNACMTDAQKATLRDIKPRRETHEND